MKSKQFKEKKETIENESSEESNEENKTKKEAAKTVSFLLYVGRASPWFSPDGENSPFAKRRGANGASPHLQGLAPTFTSQ